MKKFFSFLAQTQQISSTRVVSILAFYFLLFLNMSFWRFVFTHVEPNGFSGYLFVLSVPILIFAILYCAFSILLLPYIGKPLICVLLIISAATNYLMYQFGIFIDVDMIRNTFETNSGEVTDLITLRSSLWLILLGIIPAFWLAKAQIIFKSFWAEVWARLKCCGLLLLCMLLLFPFVCKQYVSFGRNHSQVRRLVNPFNYIHATRRYFQREVQANRTFIKLDENAQLLPYADKKQTVFVVVLGETARSMNFSLNGYKRETNPQLKKQDIVNFRHVQSAGTSTAYSVPAIFSLLPQKHFNPTNAKYTENLLDLLQQTGYEILWKENDNGCKGVCDRVPYLEMDVRDKRFCDGKYCQDDMLLEGLEEYLANLKGHAFIVLHTIGSHGPTYFRRYPEEFKHFVPTCDTEDIQTCSREQIINTYDNTLLYTDHIVSEVINLLKKFPDYESGLLYVSDHGESLGENGIYLHGIPYMIAPKEQTSVPMVLWMSELMKNRAHLNYDCLKEKAAQETFSHDYLSHSLLALMEVDSKWYDKTLDIFDSCRKVPLPRKF